MYFQIIFAGTPQFNSESLWAISEPYVGDFRTISKSLPKSEEGGAHRMGEHTRNSLQII